MITLSPNKTTGKQVYKIIRTAIEKYSKEIGISVSGSDFCRAADISRQQINRYMHGEKPGNDGIMKIASGLKKWGNDVEIKI